MSQYIESISVTKHKQEGGIELAEMEGDDRRSSGGLLGGRACASGLSERDLDFISKFGEDFPEDHLRQLVHSICPGISGNTLIKASLILALCGGNQKYADAGGKITVRGNIHMLLVGAFFFLFSV